MDSSKYSFNNVLVYINQNNIKRRGEDKIKKKKKKKTNKQKSLNLSYGKEISLNIQKKKKVQSLIPLQTLLTLK